mgnify:CR=1 FL=1
MALLQQIINGLSLGSIYALIALGYTMVYGIIKLINFAHGDIYMIGAFIGLYCGKNLGLSLLPTLIISMIGAALCGVIIEKVAYKPLRNSPRITLLITAIGISLLLENGMKLAVGSSPKAFPKLLSTEVIKLGSLSLETSKILMLVVSIMLVVFLQFIVFKTKIGKAMRAASYDIEAASLMGINVNNIISITFAIGSALAGAAGVLVSLAFKIVEPYMGMIPGLKAFIAAVLGGIGSIPGALIGGLLIGLTETLTKAYISTILSDAIVFAIVILVIFFGLNFLIDEGIINRYIKGLLTLSCINIIMAIALNLITGITGQLSLGNAGFMAIGAYTSVYFSVKVGTPFIISILLGAILAGVISIIIGIPTLKLKGDYFAITTLGVGEITRVLITNMDIVGGARGFTGIPTKTTLNVAYFAMILILIVVVNIAKSSKGRALIAIRENEIAAEAMGVNIIKYKVTAFFIAALLTGFAGGLFAHYTGFIQPTNFNFMKSIEIVTFVVLGGMGSITGSVIAAIFLTILPESLRTLSDYRMVIYSLSLVILMIFRPQGLLGTLEITDIYRIIKNKIMRKKSNSNDKNIAKEG